MLGLVGKAGTIAYSGAKGAVVSMTRTAALDYAGKRIHVNGIAPGCKYWASFLGEGSWEGCVVMG